VPVWGGCAWAGSIQAAKAAPRDAAGTLRVRAIRAAFNLLAGPRQQRLLMPWSALESPRSPQRPPSAEHGFGPCTRSDIVRGRGAATLFPPSSPCVSSSGGASVAGARSIYTHWLERDPTLQSPRLEAWRVTLVHSLIARGLVSHLRDTQPTAHYLAHTVIEAWRVGSSPTSAYTSQQIA
jgi:hypothetical protein